MDGLPELLRSHTVKRGTIAAMWVEQSHFVLKTPDGTLIHVDPFMSRAVKPESHIYPQPFLDPALTPADYVLCTHDHRDHTDPYTLGPLADAQPECRFIGPPEACVRMLDAGIAAQRVIPVPPASHRPCVGLG